MFLLDTNVVSELRKTTKADAAVMGWAQRNAPEEHWLSVMTVLELDIGIWRIAKRDPAQGSRLREWLEKSVLVTFKDRMLSVDLTIARRCAQLHVPDPRPERDALIAATALVHGLTVVTRNAADFAPMGVAVFNPWVGT